jgi:hypothetical protein
MLNWFGIIGDRVTSRIMGSLFYKVVAGIGGLVTFISGIVTIVQGKEHTLAIINSIFK